MVVLAIAKGLVAPQDVSIRSISISCNALTNRWLCLFGWKGWGDGHYSF